MDIDAPDSSPDGLVSAFSATFPLPFRVLALVGLGGLCWATNLHILDWLGIDTAQALQVPHHKPSTGLPSHTPPVSSPIASFPGSLHAHPSTLYPPIYRVVATYIAFVTGAWFLFFVLTRGEVNVLDSAKWVPAICYTAIVVAAILPLRDIWGAQRSYLYQSLYRCLFSSSSHPVYFSDVIAADILTSFAKVLGDIYISFFVLLPGGSLETSFAGGKLSDFAVPILLSVPYAIRLRQCIVEYIGSEGTSQRPMYNAVKYATAFPVIFLSAAQRLLNLDNDDQERTWYGEYAIFRLWLLSVFVNSAYSFWWDVTNDWGLSLLRAETWSKDARESSNASAYHPLAQQISASNSRSSSSGSSNSPTFAKTHFRKQSSFSALPLSSLPSTPLPIADIKPTNPSSNTYPFGLRENLLFGDKVVYYFVILINFILRFTWSLKLSSHLHSVAELESGVFLMEALELIRRWLWVFFRVEWETVKKMQEKEMGHLSLMKSLGPGHHSHSNGTEGIELFRFPEESEMDLARLANGNGES